MPVKLSNEVLNNFGEHLPTPTIEVVNVYDDKIEVTISIYMRASPQLTELSLLPANLKGIKAYIFYVLGDEGAQAIIQKTNIDIFSEFDPRAQIWYSLGTPDLSSLGDDFTADDVINDLGPYKYFQIKYPNYFQIDLSEMTIGSEELFDEEGNPSFN